MTTEEKLQHFTELCISDAKKRYDKIIEEHKKALDKSFLEHQEDEKRRLSMQIKMESDLINKEFNKELSIEELKLKKMIGDKRNEIIDKIFVELQNKLEVFMESPDYFKLLDKQIKEAIKFAGKDSLEIYIDPSDSRFINKLSMDNNINIKESRYSFMGGTRAVISDRNLLIDNSFEKKLSDAKEEFHINLGGKGLE